MNGTQPTQTSRKPRQEFWKHHITTWKDSGLTQIQYCKKKKLKVATFRYWKSRLDRQNQSRPLLPVTITPTIPPIVGSVSSGISLSVMNQINIQLDLGFNRDTLLSVLDLLESR